MADILDPLSTVAVIQPGQSFTDALEEIDALWERQCMVDALMAEEVEVTDLMDCLSSQGLNPDFYYETVIDRIDAVLRGQVVIENPEDIQIYRH
jgi:hypothetical protein